MYLNEVLFDFIEPPFFAGEYQYFASDNWKKKLMKKTALVSELLPFLFVQLARFSYDFKSMKIKTNKTIFSFPKEVIFSNSFESIISN
jgi:hypothetical protein